MYHFGDITVKDAQYVAVAFSDHQRMIVKVELPVSFSKMLPPRSCLPFKASPVVVKNDIFKERLKESLLWSERKDGLDIMVWWEEVVKPGVKWLLIQRGNET